MSLEVPKSGHKSGLLAVVLSMAVPGLGEAYAGRFDAGRYFVGSEVALWGGYAGMASYTSDFENDMENSAISEAGASQNHHGDQNYFAHVGQFQTSDLYNAEMLREGQQSQLVPNADGWRWANTTQEANFNAIRIKVQTLNNDQQFLLAAIVVNHLLSAIDAYIVTKELNKESDLKNVGKQQGMLLQFGGHMGSLNDPLGATLSARLTF
jgi:hypothetical protein